MTALPTTTAREQRVLEPPRGGSARAKPVGGVTASIALWLYAAFALIPLLLMVASSFRTNADLITDPLGAPWPVSTTSYREAWTTGNFATYFWNSLLVTVGAVVVSTVVSTMAAYALARVRSRWFAGIESVFLSGLMLPIHLAILPIFFLFDSLGLIDSRLGLALMYGAAGVPFSIFVLTTFFRQLPEELEEAAALDGASAWQTFWRIMVPLVRPALATVAVFRFVPIWNDFLFPLVLLRREEKYTLPVGLTTFFGENATNFSAVFAGLVITTVPLVVLFLLATKQIVAGLTAGMSK
ncbi:carbohydrate ABC transporter membrane protein 2, CUT1 family [Pedococcus dokdonensis]|uniref:Carbohydrate ABC transporter membrane protein 2, CUT1 family n=1 Tax=Pedococcus dokdonensis TaxID=443156 RepID=A0A1H0UGD3_9MICO|nr:carbohydrate ABC transporter permease [Pedococcus dokdonensis]SDP65085.1 carbohydrate ABC transporter membrane protein 2, CUT1 family [Pedococcus dokdonensis]